MEEVREGKESGGGERGKGEWGRERRVGEVREGREEGEWRRLHTGVSHYKVSITTAIRQ